jgi:ribosomal protein L29
MTDASKDIVIAAKNKRIKELEEDVNRIKTELMHLRGKIYGQ